MIDSQFWLNRNVFVTGHTGFKGSWLIVWLQALGARVTGYSLAPPTVPSLYQAIELDAEMGSVQADVRDYESLRTSISAAEPQVVFHLAAQPLVLASYQDPLSTFSTNILGTAHVLQAARFCKTVEAIVIVTSDKCYKNDDQPKEYREESRLGGYDPYSASKAGAELVTASFADSFYKTAVGEKMMPGVASARAGNVIGGGDWGVNRLVPDVVKSFAAGNSAVIRNPEYVRPWQHVLEPLSGYLLLAEKLSVHPKQASGAWNFGPERDAAQPVSVIADKLVQVWGAGASWKVAEKKAPEHETRHLFLDCTKAKSELCWLPRWSLPVAIEMTVRWYKAYFAAHTPSQLKAMMLRQVEQYMRSCP